MVTRLGVVFLISALFAGGFAGVVHLSDTSARYDTGCRVSTNPACFGPYQR
ncbi:hypothetical protein G6N74_14935 [Mesorhizobium sp. CGMCC 1.15528]|uniref:Uncharacterized protein n=1 Tax=Mesorhizobium zhangyense TaxID=1776730 RepID=A0A7C9R7W4_9HYPH|nr:hypothetical protein [Mesorhizobium zhangyense]NGN42362.1 hypothetical protein [Mesorhizobium zhangyense]